MSRLKDMSDFDLSHLVDVVDRYGVDNGFNNAEIAKELLEYFVYCYKNNLLIQPVVMKWIAESFEMFVSGERTIEIAFGLKKKKGRPKNLAHTFTARKVLEYLFQGYNKEKAIQCVINDSNGKLKISTLRDIFDKFIKEEWFLYRVEQHIKNIPITEKEAEVVRRYIDKKFSTDKSLIYSPKS